MGNQHEIRQLTPRCQLGVVIPIKDDATTRVHEVLAPDPSHYYMSVHAAHQSATLHNLDFDSTTLDPQPFDVLYIQSGGKMWCGYDAFQEILSELATCLADATFFVGDELWFIDRFDIRRGALTTTRVHEGYWLDLEEFMLPIIQDLQKFPTS